MGRLVLLIALVVILPVLLVLDASLADSASADNETAANQTEASNSSASEDIYGLRIENINKNGADFYWSTSIKTKGSIEYAYTKLAQQYNPQSSGSQQTVLITAVPARVKSEPGYFKTHHIRVDNLDMYYHPFVEYTIKSETFSGEVFTLSGEFVLVDTVVLQWWQSREYAILAPIVPLVLGLLFQIIIIPRIRKAFQSRKAKKAMLVPLD